MQNANDAYSSNVKAISEDKTIVDEEKRFQALLDAEELFRQQKYAINEKYTLMEQELQKSSRQTEIEIYGQLLSQASSVWGNMTAMVKESAGEQSAAYKAMFLVQQAMAMGTATIQAYQAYSNVLANAPYPLNMTMAPIALGLGMANVGLIAAQTIAGFSDGGYTGNGLKHTPAGLCIKVRLFGRKKILNAGVVLALLKVCVKAIQVVMRTEVTFLIISLMLLQYVESLDSLRQSTLINLN